MSEQDKPLSTDHHDRQFYGEDKLVYPVLSRRAEGISIGINTFPNKLCNFGCIYCEVDRLQEGGQFNLMSIHLIHN